MCFVWPYIQGGLNTFSHQMIDANRTLAAFIFGLIERSLIPFGLHHISIHRSGSNSVSIQMQLAN